MGNWPRAEAPKWNIQRVTLSSLTQSGWRGELCELPLCGQGCGPHGSCVRPGVCSCQPGYTGATCQEVSCQPPCQNGGLCVRPFTCRCPPGASGRYCEECEGGDCGPLPAPCPLTCLHGGHCNQQMDKCVCKQNYFGHFCQKRYEQITSLILTDF